MAITITSLSAVVTATTAGGTSAAKVEALLTGLHDAVLKEVCRSQPVAVNQQQRTAQVRAELAANVADFQTALGL